jgi:hypothetical protein
MTITVYYIANVWEKDDLDIKYANEFVTDYDIHAANGRGYDEYELTWMVEDICKDYFRNHDGWEVESTWSDDGVVFALWDDNKNFIGTFDTQLEYDPTFTVYRSEK